MDLNTVVLEISSDEESDWNDNGGIGIADASDDHNWLAELLDEVNKENYGGGDSDEVVVVNEAGKLEKELELKACLVDSDDDCVVLDNDPDKPVEVWNDNRTTGNDDSDELLVVSEKGQVACRDYPHPRHLCIKFPFSATPNQSHCNQCYCYVCDSLAPCVYWGNGSSSTNHCHATDKDESWRLQRKTAKNPKITDPSRPPPMDPLRPAPTPVHVPRLGSTRPRHPPANFVVPSIINPNKFNPGLVSQLLLRTNGARSQGHGHHDYNLATQLHRPVFKRPGSAGVTPTVNRSQNGSGSYRSNFGYTRQQNYTSSTINQPLSFDSRSADHPETPVFYQPNLVPLPSYPIPPQTRVDSHSPSIHVSDYIIDPSSKDHEIVWPAIETSHQSATPMNEPSSLSAISGGLMACDNWIFGDQPVEPDVPGGYYDSTFIDTGPFFEF